jgi:hypothetical protein
LLRELLEGLARWLGGLVDWLVCWLARLVVRFVGWIIVCALRIASCIYVESICTCKQTKPHLTLPRFHLAQLLWIGGLLKWAFSNVMCPDAMLSDPVVVLLGIHSIFETTTLH